jgi:phosphoglycolate phosphatase
MPQRPAPSPLTTVLLDLDGTLIDSRQDLVDAVNHTLKTLGHPEQSFDEVVSRIGNGLRRLISDTVGIIEQTKLNEAKAIFESFYDVHCLDHTRLYDGVMEGLRTLFKDIRLGVVTNKPTAFSVKIIRGLRLHPYIETIVGGDSLAEAKPHPAPLEEAMRIMRSRPSETMMVGDGIQDLKAAQSARLSICVAEYGFGFRPELLDLKPNYVIKSFMELREIL